MAWFTVAACTALVFSPLPHTQLTSSPSQLSCALTPTAGQRRHAILACADQQPLSTPPKSWRKRAQQLASGVGLGLSGMLLNTVSQPAEAAALPPQDAPTSMMQRQRQRQSVGGRMVGAMTQTVTIGAAGYFFYKKTVDEDDEEEDRIKKENERLEKMAKEFTDIDEGVVSDDDMFAALRERMSNSTSTDGEGGEGGTPPPPTGGPAGPPSPPTPKPPPPPSPSGGGAAVLEPPTPSAATPPMPGASDADVERLKRMFGSSAE